MTSNGNSGQALAELMELLDDPSEKKDLSSKKQVGEYENDVLSALIVLDRTVERLEPNSRMQIKRSGIQQLESSLGIVSSKIYKKCKEINIMNPILEIAELCTVILSDKGFVETDADTKGVICNSLYDALNALYLFAGKYYMEHHFEYYDGQFEILCKIVNKCIESGFYFGLG